MSTQHRHQIRDRRPRTLALAIALALAPLPVLAQTALGELPRDGNVIRGNASISYNPGQFTHVALRQATTITQTTRGAVIEWGSFSIGAQNAVTFNHQVAGGVTLNRVIGFGAGATPSNIFGSLSAPNGSVFLVNPSGVLFGVGSTVNVGGLIASTLDISNDDFDRGVANGSYAFGTGIANQGNVENDGTITANPGGTVALLGGRVLNGNGTNDASISAPQGTVALGVGSQITVNIGGDGLTQLQIDTSAVNPNGTYAQNAVHGKLVADGGQVLMQALGNPFASVVNNGIVQARSMTSRAGRIVLSSASDDGTSNSVNVQGGTLDVSGTTAGVGGGAIEMDAYNIGVLGLSCAICEGPPPPPTPSLIDASGGVGGGTISINASNVVEIGGLATLDASATNNGNGGSIIVHGANGLYAFGRFNAEGGANGGNGGLVETSGGGVSMGGIQVSVKAPRGTAGQWLIDPYDVTIVHGNAAGTLPANPFDPITDSIIRDGDINNALNGGSDVTITSGTGGAPDVGDIYIDGGFVDPATGLAMAVDILRSSGTAALTFRLDANAGIGGTNFQIHSTAGALNVIFDSDANGANSDNGNMAFTQASIQTNGGNLSMVGQNDPVNGFATSRYYGGIQLDAVTLDTRIGGSDANASGNILLRGSGSCLRSCLSGAVVELIGSNLYASTGSIQISGFGAIGVGINSGVVLDSNGDGGPATVLRSTSGAITVIGVSAGDGSVGLHLGEASVGSIGGGIDLRGHGDFDGGTFSDGLDVAAGAAVRSTSGLTLLSGSSDGSGAGINVATGALIDAGSGNIVARAHNNGSTDALVLGGTLSTTGAIDLRPGSVSASGSLLENPGDAIALGGTTGFGISAAELGNLSAATLILGSSVQTGAISVLAPVAYGHNLTLQSGAGIALNAALDMGAHTLALIGGGSITQTAPITAASLLVQSSAGSVSLTNAANRVSAATLAGSARGNFTFINAGSVGIGTVLASGFDATGSVSTSLSGSGVIGGGDVLVRALNGNMTLRANVSGNYVDLVSNGVFDNSGGNTIAATGNWQVWGNSWVGENRGGLAGNGNLPNLYGCTFGGACGVSPSATANQFIYTAQPVAIITFSNSSREYGLPNAGISYSVGGMILADQASNAINGSFVTAATQASGVGNYTITGAFVSPAGYLVNVVPGTLAIMPATLLYDADPYSRVYGNANATPDGTVSGFRLADTQANATSGSLLFSTSATQASNVGTYAISGSGLGATNYVFAQAVGNANALRITPATLTYVADPYSRVYGDANATLAGTVSGFRLADTQANATSGSLLFSTNATQASNVGTYAIAGSGLSATNYVFAQAVGNANALRITPATLTYAADPRQRQVGVPNVRLNGSVTGFRNSDTLASATAGTITFDTPADINSPMGLYAINGSGLSANNYIFTQAAANAVALTITPPAATYSLDIVREAPVTYVYDSNFGIVGLCPATDLAAGSREQDGDTLSREWSRVRSRPNLANCVSTRQKNSCRDF